MKLTVINRLDQEIQEEVRSTLNEVRVNSISNVMDEILRLKTSDTCLILLDDRVIYDTEGCAGWYNFNLLEAFNSLV